MDQQNAKYTAFVASRIRWFPTRPEDLMHMAVGIIGEVVELRAAESRENAEEELGDICFYHTGAKIVLDRMDIQIPTMEDSFDFSTLDEASEEMLQSAGKFLDLAKKIWVYRDSPEKTATLGPRLTTQWNFLNDAIDFIVDYHGMDRGSLEVQNTVKLTDRYPTGYTDAAAKARADKPEGE